MGHYVLIHELIAIVRRLDLNKDNKIDYNEFYEGLTPVSSDMIPTLQSKPVGEYFISSTPAPTKHFIRKFSSLSPET